MHSPRKLLMLLAVLAAGVLTPAAASASPLTDPAGDTIGFFAPQLDIINSNGFVILPGGTTMRLTVNFAGSISPASAFAPNSVVGYVDLDLDRNAGTGATPFINTYGGAPPVAMGDEAYIDLFSELFHTGFVDLYDANTFALLGSLPIVYTPNGFAIDMPIAAINGRQPFTYAVTVGTFIEPTDRAPNGQVAFLSAVPEPMSLAVFGGLAVCGLVAVRRRRHQA